MVITITLNPAIDNIVALDTFVPGEINRVTSEHVFAGGKGVNVSKILAELGSESIATGFLAGAVGYAYEELLKEAGLSYDFIRLTEGNTRINTKISAREETEINGSGPKVTFQDLDLLCEKITGMQGNHILVLSGNVPAGLKGAYQYILDKVRKRKFELVVDTTGEELENTLAFGPFLIKPNIAELSELFGMEIKTEDRIKNCCEKLQERGARNILVSRGRDGACLYTEDEDFYIVPGISGQVGNTVGSGDSMVAGFLHGWIRYGSYKEALRIAAAAGTATAFSFGLADKEKIQAYISRVEIY